MTSALAEALYTENQNITIRRWNYENTIAGSAALLFALAAPTFVAAESPNLASLLGQANQMNNKSKTWRKS
jgi:hypothetical protein